MTPMVRWRPGRVDTVRRRWAGSVEGEVRLDEPFDDRATVRALAFPALVGEPVAGGRGLLTPGARERGLGTGGYALVAALPDRLPAAPPPTGEVTGHLVKARYTPLQAMVTGVDEQGSAHHD